MNGFEHVGNASAEEIREQILELGRKGVIVPAPPVEARELRKWVSRVHVLRQIGESDPEFGIGEEEFRRCLRTAESLFKGLRAEAESSKAKAARSEAKSRRIEVRLLETVEYGGSVVALRDRVRESIRTAKRATKRERVKALALRGATA